MSRLRNIAIAASHRLNHALGARWGETFPFYYVSEYPKSGGTWLSKMIGDVLQIPVPQRSIFPIGCSAVLHNHWGYDGRLRRVVYLYRDGRDVVVSSLFHLLRHYRDPKAPAHHESVAHLHRVFGRGFDPDDPRALLPRFVEDSFRHPLGNRLSWSEHIRAWHDPARTHIAYVSYEQLRTDPHAHLRRVVEHIAERTIEDWKIDMAVEKFSIERQTGRKQGQEDRSHFIRKGMPGDWVNHFTPESARIFHDLAGDVLIRLGYEADASWVDRVGADP